MSTPPLPEIFGNYALENFSEVVSPEKISWLPQTAGWYWLGAIVLLVSLRYIWRALRHWYHNRYRREACRLLLALPLVSGQENTIASINKILKITAIVAYSRGRVAKLSGKVWVNFLNQQCEHPVFNEELGTLLATGMYHFQDVSQARHKQLVDAGLAWVISHRRCTHV